MSPDTPPDDTRLRAAIRRDLATPAPQLTAAAVMRRARRQPRSRWHATAPSPGLLLASFAALLLATPVAIANWPGPRALDATILAFALGDPASVEPSLALFPPETSP